MDKFVKDSLGDRIKQYEAATTEQYFMSGLPLYARLDGRAFHTFTRGFGVPFPKCENFDLSFHYLMQEVCRELVKHTNATLGFVESDEISLGWTDISKAPFDKRKFKLESVLASLCTGIFVEFVLNTNHKLPDYISPKDWGKIRNKTMQIIPSFDCRVFQLPNLMELANCFVWRENDAIKNSISSYAQRIFSKSELHGKNQKQRLEMLAANGHDWSELHYTVRRGTYFHRVVIEHETDAGEKYFRSEVKECFTHEQLAKIENKVEYLFEPNVSPILINRSLGESGDVRHD